LCDRVALMHHGRLRAVGTPTKLKSTVSSCATLEDVFRHYTATDLSDQPETAGSFREIRSGREVASRVS
jgi:ABC-2 type transport system ATP-binding protein